MRIRRPFAVLSSLGTAAHHTFEVRAGVGLVFEPFLGRRGAWAFWSAVLPMNALVAAFGGPRHNGAVAFNAGSALAGVIVHYVDWPWVWKRGLPTLTAAEGLRPDQVPAYDLVLKGWGAASALALLRERGLGTTRYAVAGLLTGFPLLASARHHFAWAREQAERDPESWSPALLATAEAGP